MDYKAIIDFLVISVPEQFLMALFAWVLLGKKERIQLQNVFLVGVITAVIFFLAQVLLQPDMLVSLVQLLGLAVLIYFGYRLSILETAFGCLITLVFFTLVQGVMVVLARVFTNVSQEEIINGSPIRTFCIIAEFIIISLIVLFMYKKNINIYYLKKNKLDKSQRSRLSFLALQLAFALFTLIVIYYMFIINTEVFKSLLDKVLVVSSFIITIIFTTLLVRSVFKVGEAIQKEEKVKRQMDGRELIQNIDYLCALIDEKQYGELKRVLESIKNDIESGMINLEKGSNREILSDKS